MKVPPKRKGNFWSAFFSGMSDGTLNESPSEKEGKLPARAPGESRLDSLNESPSEKEGKWSGNLPADCRHRRPQ